MHLINSKILSNSLKSRQLEIGRMYDVALVVPKFKWKLNHICLSVWAHAEEKVNQTVCKTLLDEKPYHQKHPCLKLTRPIWCLLGWTKSRGDVDTNVCSDLWVPWSLPPCPQSLQEDLQTPLHRSYFPHRNSSSLTRLFDSLAVRPVINDDLTPI